MQIKTTLRYHLTTVRMAKLKIANVSLCWRGCGIRGTFLYCWCECKLVQSLWKSLWWILWKLGSNLPQDQSITVLGICPKDAQLYYKAISSITFIAAVFAIAITWKQSRSPSTEEWIKKKCHIYTIEYYSVIKNNDNLKFVCK